MVFDSVAIIDIKAVYTVPCLSRTIKHMDMQIVHVERESA